MAEKAIKCPMNDVLISEDALNIMEDEYKNDGCRDNDVLVSETTRSVNNESNTVELENYVNCDNTRPYEITSINIKSEFPSDEMDVKIEEGHVADPVFVENIANIKREYEDDECIDDEAMNENADELKVYVKDEIENSDVDNIQTQLYDLHSSEMDDVVKIENEVVVKENHNEFDNTFSSCNHSDEDYKNYCNQCRMLVAILDRNTSCNTDNKAIEEIPKDILEAREMFGSFRIFALKTVPEGVRFGPFTGVYTSNQFWTIKGGRFIVSDDKLEFLNWMQYINPAQTNPQHNLFAFQYEDNIYYRTTREIHAGEELLVYFGEAYEYSLINDSEMDFNPHLETDIKDVFACTFCCLGFSSEIYLTKHKALCFYKTEGSFLNKDVTQCPHCKIYLEQWEYLEHHMTYCREKNFRQCILSTPKDHSILSSKCYSQRHKMYKVDLKNSRKLTEKKTLELRTNETQVAVKEEETLRCFLCEWEMKDESHLNLHLRSDHFEGGKYRCTKCEYGTNRKGNLKMHFVKHEEVKQFKCSQCDYATRFKQSLDRHFGTHEPAKRFKCSQCNFTTNISHTLKRHLDTHDAEKRFKCGQCEYATRQKCSLKRHLDTHESVKGFKCLKCEYTTRSKHSLLRHFYKHETVRRFKCSQCDYAAKYESNLARHMATHVKLKQLKCSKCEYVTNHKSNLILHFSTHETVRRFKCSQCNYAATSKKNLGKHSYKHRTTQLFKCSMCDYVTYQGRYLKKHSAKHETVKRFNCSKCKFQTNYKAYLKVHVCKPLIVKESNQGKVTGASEDN